jgi:8-oxo-dGTP pyrophosphatase MutT (NUDIX family)
MHHPRLVAVSVPVYLPDISDASGADLDIPADLQALRVPLFMMCSSRKHADRWVLPKGGVEKGETSAEAAMREGWVRASTRRADFRRS